MTYFRKFSVSLAVVGLIAWVSSADSCELLEPLVKPVFYADLNLDTSEGVRTLYARLRQAARAVCSPLKSRDLDRKNLWQACYASALTSAVTQVNKPSVTALHHQSR